MNQFMTEIQAVDWHVFEDAPKTLIALALANQESTENIYQIEGINVDLLLNARITSDVLFAIGNNHRGTYYPISRKALPFIVQIALYGNHVVARNCAINILIDLFYFCPDVFYKEDDELECFIKETIRTAITDNREAFTQFELDDKRNKSLVEGLMAIVDEDEG